MFLFTLAVIITLLNGVLITFPNHFVNELSEYLQRPDQNRNPDSNTAFLYLFDSYSTVTVLDIFSPLLTGVLTCIQIAISRSGCKGKSNFSNHQIYWQIFETFFPPFFPSERTTKIALFNQSSKSFLSLQPPTSIIAQQPFVPSLPKRTQM